MKTTVEITDELAKKAKRLAASRNTTLREVIEQGLRLALREERAQRTFKLRDASVAGSGMREEYKDADWAKIRAAVYAGRGS